MRPDFVGLGGFDSHAFPPRASHRPLCGRLFACGFVAALLLLAAPAHAQGDSAGVKPPVAARRAATKPPISPAKAFLASALVPGLGQAQLNRSTGVFFAITEVVGLGMAAKSQRDLALARAFAGDSTPSAYVIDPGTGLAKRDSVTGKYVVQSWEPGHFSIDRVHARRTQVEDWLAIVAFNHLFAGLDAFVAAQLWDLPANVQFRAAPGGGAINARIHW